MTDSSSSHWEPSTVRFALAHTRLSASFFDRRAPFGYEYKEARTVLDDMRGRYSVVYIRHEFTVEHADRIAEIGLMFNYDDGFIAYLNGREVVRKGVGQGSGQGALEVKSHDASKYSYFPLKEFEKHV